VKRAAAKPLTRREELLDQCQRERYELVATTATALALVPRARRVAHWIRAVSRMLRVVSASMRAG
jgi:hypothetical protein